MSHTKDCKSSDPKKTDGAKELFIDQGSEWESAERRTIRETPKHTCRSEVRCGAELSRSQWWFFDNKKIIITGRKSSSCAGTEIRWLTDRLKNKINEDTWWTRMVEINVLYLYYWEIHPSISCFAPSGVIGGLLVYISRAHWEKCPGQVSGSLQFHVEIVQENQWGHLVDRCGED